MSTTYDKYGRISSHDPEPADTGPEPAEYRYAVAIDGTRFIQCNDAVAVERTITAALRRGRNDVVEVEDRVARTVETYRMERRLTRDRRTATVPGEEVRRSGEDRRA